MNYLVIDVGGTSIKYAMMDDEYKMWDKGSIDDLPDNHEDFMLLLDRLYAEKGRPEGGIAMSYCGVLDPASGFVYAGGTHAFNGGHNMKTELEGMSGCTVSIENDACCAAIAEVAQGSLVGKKDALVFVVGTGFGGCIVKDGKILRGVHGVVGSFPGLITDIDADFATVTDIFTAPIANTYLSAPRLVAGYAELAGEGYEDVLPANGKEFFALVEAGDEVALRALRRYARRFAQVVCNLQQLLDVEAVAVGGGISAAPALIRALSEELDRVFEAPLTMFLGCHKPFLCACDFRNDANLIGALAHKLGAE